MVFTNVSSSFSADIKCVMHIKSGASKSVNELFYIFLVLQTTFQFSTLC